MSTDMSKNELACELRFNAIRWLYLTLDRSEERRVGKECRL